MSFSLKSCLMSTAVAAVAFAGAAKAEDKVVNVYNWEEYIDDTTLADFEKETGIKVVYSTFDSNDTLEAKILAGHSGYDVVFPSGAFLERQIQAGAYQALDKSKLPNITHMDPDIMEKMALFDPGNEHAVDYMWGMTAIGYNVDKIKEIMPDAPIDSWKIVFDPEVAAKFKDCGIAFLNAPDEVVPAALRYLGEDPNSKDPEVLKKALPVLEAVRPFIARFEGSSMIDKLATGDICLAIAWNGDVFQAKAAADAAGSGVNVAFSIPKEGAQLWFDSMAILADAPHPDAAHAFINYMMTPEVIARNSAATQYANGNKGADPLMDPEVTSNPGIYPPSEVMKTLYLVTAYSQKEQRVLNKIWETIKLGD
ncbi:polyamine ABC transporter substrate-binding protein [Zavarzinia compransoris]|uniref:polyamine ABC transporter substrate-binding protein n=1 Tax=Zavarzinia marina TaxID=2911065 RepID=UPI001F17E93B|nr:polyamine ABC transporter substrate-binding protein [Zavarzinia marina]MCF4167500.1 polyamine ABC transporter substrate-binding protein [Zavarzinia marina]